VSGLCHRSSRSWPALGTSEYPSLGQTEEKQISTHIEQARLAKEQKEIADLARKEVAHSCEIADLRERSRVFAAAESQAAAIS
jgi:hypothetical protein